MINVEIVYAPEEKPLFHIHLSLFEGATVMEAISQSGLETLYPQTANSPVGLFSKRVSRDTVLKEGDRIEVYRPLTLDPKEKRRQRAEKQSSTRTK